MFKVGDKVKLNLELLIKFPYDTFGFPSHHPCNENTVVEIIDTYNFDGNIVKCKIPSSSPLGYITWNIKTKYLIKTTKHHPLTSIFK